MDKYTLDLEKWVCGFGEPFPKGIGKGRTAMLNDSGFMCCLGQFAGQSGMNDYLMDNESPENVARCINKVYDNNFCFSFIGESGINNTDLAERCIEINDDSRTDIWTKLCLLADRLAKDGITLLVTGNLPIPAERQEIK